MHLFKSIVCRLIGHAFTPWKVYFRGRSLSDYEIVYEQRVCLRCHLLEKQDQNEALFEQKRRQEEDAVISRLIAYDKEG